MNIIPNTKIFLDERRALSKGIYPIKLKVTFKRTRRYYSIFNLSATKMEFAKITGLNIPKEKTLKKIYFQVNKFKREADQYLSDVKEFSFDRFRDEFIKSGLQDEDADVFSYFDDYITKLKDEGRLNTADSYSYAKKRLQEFYKHKKLPFGKINQSFLEDLEKEMLADYSITSIGIWLRSLRTIINIALKNGLTDYYPFGKGKYQIKNPSARKMAPTTEELQKLFSYKPCKEGSEAYWFDLWKFSYLCNGMNVKDICNLKYSAIEGNKILYLREKTKRTNLKGKEISIPLNDEIKRIIYEWSSKPENPNKYIFPILKKGLTEEQKQIKIKQAVKQINKYSKRVAEKLELSIKISSYTARHGYATQLMRHGAPVAFISKQLGHSSLKVTEDYLENFEERQLEEWQKKITDFNIK